MRKSDCISEMYGTPEGKLPNTSASFPENTRNPHPVFRCVPPFLT